ncbi:ATP-dependent DNA helicase RecG [Verticiella sediminum]|uniref:ATP-dependent DNA helicase RecG n=1 Tax=Verticiella sediminum TaxID=1247510 RepID=UPI001FEC2AC2|nr:ATP-dependent DNA helicase RecG [Verticiella sediminum]
MSAVVDPGSQIERKLHKLGLRTPADCLLHLPLRYEDETRVTDIGRLLPGVFAQVEGEVTRCEVQMRPRRQLVAAVADETGELALRFLNFYPSQQRQLAVGSRVRVRGEPRGGLFGLEMVHPRVGGADAQLPQRLTPVYPTTQGLAQSILRRQIAAALAQADLSDSLPDVVRERWGLCGFADALRELHTPAADATVEDLAQHTHPAWRRVKFDELLAQQLSLALARAERRSRRAPAMPRAAGADTLFERLLAQLPFRLSKAQQRVVAEISADLGRAHPMQRLLQGDVGAGKTVVAALAAAQAIDHGYQVALMAPTEILAEQHLRKFGEWLAPLGVNIAWLSGSLSAKARREPLAALASGEAQLIVGTQALIQEHVQFHRLGLAITDEQHRFGVGQRLALREKGVAGADGIHQLMMSATPIPRTLAMTVYADLDVSEIDELPPGRTPVLTKLVNDVRRDEVVARIHVAVEAGRQAYWVCPLVEESEALELQTAVDTFETLRAALPQLRVGLVHGKLPTAEKAEVMRAFKAGELDLLVATTVIEVGVDVPNASLMVIEHAERFGLAQLHQLRGRVGRGSAESICVLMYQAPLSRVAKQRLRTMHETTDGFLIAQRDLALRGPGEFLGVRQSGEALLRFADLREDGGLVDEAREAAAWMLAEYPDAVHAHLARWLRGRENFLKA